MYTWCTRRWNFKIVKKSSPRIRHVLWARWISRGVECCDMIRTMLKSKPQTRKHRKSLVRIVGAWLEDRV